MIAIVFALLSGATIVISRSINGYLTKQVGVYQSTFYNYFVGLITSILLLLIMRLLGTHDLPFLAGFHYPYMLIGSVIGVFNIIILNIVIYKVPPIKLTILTFIAQIVTGLILDYLFYQIFSITKLLGCIIVIIGLIIYQLND